MRCNKSGFTLIEIIIALLILGVGLVGLLALFPVGFDAAGKASNIITATFLAQEQMEELKRDGYGGSTLTTALSTTTPNPNGTFDSPYEYYQYEIDAIAGISDGGGGRRLAGSICEVIVDVYWPAEGHSPGNRTGQRNVELKTYIANYE
jgi:type IV pilus assembly protein PilV